MDGNIFDIQRFSVHDGPGIRTTVFLKGCPLKCIWCHNPESQKSEICIAYYANKCVSCGSCTSVCEKSNHKIIDGKHIFDRENCTYCKKCSQACPNGAIEILGRHESTDAILSEVTRDKLFYKNSGGGMTVSGGEPLMQPDFLLALLKGAKEQGIHTCIETCGFAKPQIITEVAKYTDIFLFDIKETDDARHKELTGVSFTPIKENLMILNKLGAKIVLRCPLVPDINTRPEHLEGIAKIAIELENLLEINVMAYHLLGNSKYDALEMKNNMQGHEAMTTEQKNECIRIISDNITRLSGKTIKVT